MKASKAKLAADKAAFSTPEARKLKAPTLPKIRLTRLAEQAQDAARIASGSVALNMSIALADELERECDTSSAKPDSAP